MTTADAIPPKAVLKEAATARTLVRQALDFDLDETDATLPVLDHYLRQLTGAPPTDVDRIIGALGCHFGEVVRTRFGGRWVLPSEEPGSWRVELTEVGLSFQPAAVVAQAVYHGRDEAWDDTVSVAPADRQSLGEALERMVQLPETVYYTLASRFDTLETIVDFLVATHAEALQKP